MTDSRRLSPETLTFWCSMTCDYRTMLERLPDAFDDIETESPMSTEFVKFLSDHKRKVARFLVDLDLFKDELRQRVEWVAGRIDLRTYTNVVRRASCCTSNLEHFLVHELRLADDLVLVLVAVASPHGWETRIIRRGLLDNARVRELLKRRDIPVRDKGYYFRHDPPCPYDAPLTLVADLLQDLIARLSRGDPDEPQFVSI